MRPTVSAGKYLPGRNVNSPSPCGSGARVRTLCRSGSFLLPGNSPRIPSRVSPSCRPNTTGTWVFVREQGAVFWGVAAMGADVVKLLVPSGAGELADLVAEHATEEATAKAITASDSFIGRMMP